MNPDQVMQFFVENRNRFGSFKDAVVSIFANEPSLSDTHTPIIHSLKSRFKSEQSLRSKIQRKIDKGVIFSPDNVAKEITDYVGVRVLHLYSFQAEQIDSTIKRLISDGDWKLFEKPKAYTWDPDSQIFFQNMGFECELKDSHYTSLHYVVQPNNLNAQVSCEIQVRTLFEEVWGEIDHAINYPIKTGIFACKEQLRVLSKLVSTGTRLADSIHRIHSHHSPNKSS
jgi:ppGpp synthetase/RelA/SpoT-type nucleotidyltranferase